MEPAGTCSYDMANAATFAQAVVSVMLEDEEPSPEELVQSVPSPLRFPLDKQALAERLNPSSTYVTFRIAVPESVYSYRRANIGVLNDWVSEFITGDESALEGISYTNPKIVGDHVAVTVSGDVGNFLADDER